MSSFISGIFVWFAAIIIVTIVHISKGCGYLVFSPTSSTDNAAAFYSAVYFNREEEEQEKKTKPKELDS